jgi:SAM-dependent methyltransferase
VLEHIPGEGDTRAMQEIARVLKPGGILAISVPFIEKAGNVVDQYISDKFYYSGHSVKNNSGNIFFQRLYSETALESRLIYPSGLQLTKKIYLGQRVDWNVSRYIDNKITHPFFGVLYLLFAKIFLRYSEDLSTVKRVGGVILILQKRTIQ